MRGPVLVVVTVQAHGQWQTLSRERTEVEPVERHIEWQGRKGAVVGLYTREERMVCWPAWTCADLGFD